MIISYEKEDKKRELLIDKNSVTTLLLDAQVTLLSSTHKNSINHIFIIIYGIDTKYTMQAVFMVSDKSNKIKRGIVMFDVLMRI